MRFIKFLQPTEDSGAHMLINLQPWIWLEHRTNKNGHQPCLFWLKDMQMTLGSCTSARRSVRTRFWEDVADPEHLQYLLCSAANAVVHIFKYDAIINKWSAVQTLFRHSFICLFPFSLLLTESLSQVFVNSFGTMRFVVIIPLVIQPGMI